MLKNERQQAILNSISENSFVTVSQLSSELAVSEMTIRRDINDLAKQNKLIKIYGGAQRMNLLDKEKTSEEKSTLNINQKKQIGTIMNSLIKDNDTVFLGAGTTIYHALSQINKKKLFIITNNLLALNYLKSHTDFRIILTGGEFYPATEEFVGNFSAQSLNNINIDISFAACNGLYENNVTFARTSQAPIQNAALTNSRIKCLVADSTKIGVSDIYTLSKLDSFDYLITDDNLPHKLKAHYEQYTKILTHPLT
ncbi:DeoR/GlpR family DNA-binding transcription regulator [Lactovum odontotermitis]